MEKEKLAHIRHTLAHLLASVILEKYPNAKLTLGPAIENGFYYDIDFGEEAKPVEEKDFEALTKAMQKKLVSGGKFTHSEVTPKEARETFKNNPYKLELIDEIVERGEPITLYTIQDFTDLCRGGHVEDLSEIDPQSFRITHTAGAYWRGNEQNKMLTRVYGLAFANANDLDNYDVMLAEAQKRDHKLLGKQLGLFVFSPLVGPGLPLWTPKGTFLRNQINNYVQELRSKYDYQEVTIPHLTKKDLYIKSGHWEKYQEDLFKIETRDGHTLCIKPMNCPHHAQIYASELRSYKELPIRYRESTMVYRDEQSGELNGLSRVLSITQDDAHVFCREEQIETEANSIWNIIEEFYQTFHFSNLQARFSRRNDDPKFKGDPELWKKAESAIKNLLEKKVGDNYSDGVGEAAFYGPKIDFMAKDALGREHQIATIQLDFIQPRNLELEYVNETGARDIPVMIHCAIAGSLERFLSVYVEHVAGEFPLWLAPTQLAVIPVNSKKHNEFSEKLAQQLKTEGLRVEFNPDSNGLGKEIRKAKEQKYPYWLVIGDQEIETGELTLESRNGEKTNLKFEQLIEKLKTEVEEKR